VVMSLQFTLAGFIYLQCFHPLVAYRSYPKYLNIFKHVIFCQFIMISYDNICETEHNIIIVVELASHRALTKTTGQLSEFLPISGQCTLL